MTTNILYIQPFESFGNVRFLTECLPRISSYLNSKRSELEYNIEEEYLDLRCENLPRYCPENIDSYREDLKELLCSIYERFKFDIAAISCYTSFTYLNSLEVANMIKHFINPSCYIIVGGFHPSVFPKDFYPKSIPSYFDKFYPKNTTPIDYIVIDEGEIPFFHFIKDVQKGIKKTKKKLKDKPIILERELVENLDDLPLIDINLFRKYEEIINSKEEFYILFTRGCLFRCKFCPPSENYMESYKMVRYKSVDKCISEIKKIINTEWLSQNLKTLMIMDNVLFPKKSQRALFFKELEKINKKKRRPSLKIYTLDRIDVCSIEDLENYKRFNMFPAFGLETGSPTLLCRIGKIPGNDSLEKAKDYLQKTEDLIKKAN